MVVSARQRSEADPEEYATATGRMRELAPRQPVFPGVELVRGADGFGINVSCRERAAAITAWRAHARHAGIRRHGLARWYRSATSSRAQGSTRRRLPRRCSARRLVHAGLRPAHARMPIPALAGVPRHTGTP